MVGQYHERGDGGGEGLVAGHGGFEGRLAAALEVGEGGREGGRESGRVNEMAERRKLMYMMIIDRSKRHNDLIEIKK
jgi:hypothetical protein